MSALREAREALGAACSTVPGVAGYDLPPSAPGPGDAWPQLIAVDPQRFPSATWAVVVVLGTSQDDAVLRLDEVYDDMREALTEADLQLTEVRPGALTAGGAQLLAAEFIGRRSLV